MSATTLKRVSDGGIRIPEYYATAKNRDGGTPPREHRCIIDA